MAFLNQNKFTVGICNNAQRRKISCGFKGCIHYSDILKMYSNTAVHVESTTDTCSCLFIVMYFESTLLCNPYYLKSCGCGCSEMSLSLLFAPTPSHCHKCSFCLGGRCEDRLAAEGSAYRSLADPPFSHCGLVERGAGHGASLEHRVALLVGGAPAQQTRHAPARFALPIGRAWRPISGTETRGKHRRVHVPFVHSGGGGGRMRRGREGTPGSRLSQTGTA